MHILETIDIMSDCNLDDPRFPVQYVIRPQSADYPDYRGYAGRIDGGVFRKGDEIVVMPQQKSTVIESIDFFHQSLEQAFPPMSVTIRIKDDIDISRGDMFVKKDNMPSVTRDITAMVCWMSDRPLQLNGKYALKHTTKDVRCVIRDVLYKVNVNNLHQNKEDRNVTLNEIACVSLRTTQPLLTDPYKRNRKTGSLILIDEGTNNTVGVGMVISSQ